MPVVSLDHLTLFELTPPELVTVAHAAGFAHVGLRLNPAAPPAERQHPMIGDTPMRRETLSRMRGTGVAVFDFGVFRLKEGIDTAAFEPVLETAAILGARNAVVNGDDPDPGRTADLLHRLCELGEAHGIAMHLEPTPWSGVRSLRAAVDIVERCGHPQAHVMIDPIHVDRSKATLRDLAQVPCALIAYVQVCDAAGPRPEDFETMIDQARNDRAFPGEGNLDLVGMLNALPAGLPLSLESPVRSLAALPPVERARRGYRAVMSLLAAAASRRREAGGLQSK